MRPTTNLSRSASLDELAARAECAWATVARDPVAVALILRVVLGFAICPTRRRGPGRGSGSGPAVILLASGAIYFQQLGVRGGARDRTDCGSGAGWLKACSRAAGASHVARGNAESPPRLPEVFAVSLPPPRRSASCLCCRWCYGDGRPDLTACRQRRFAGQRNNLRCHARSSMLTQPAPWRCPPWPQLCSPGFRVPDRRCKRRRACQCSCWWRRAEVSGTQPQVGGAGWRSVAGAA